MLGARRSSDPRLRLSWIAGPRPPQLKVRTTPSRRPRDRSQLMRFAGPQVASTYPYESSWTYAARPSPDETSQCIRLCSYPHFVKRLPFVVTPNVRKGLLPASTFPGASASPSTQLL